MATAEKGSLRRDIKIHENYARPKNRYVAVPCVDFIPSFPFRRIKIKIHDAIGQKTNAVTR